MTTYTTAEVNTWFQTIDGLPPTTASIPSNLATAYVDDLNATPTPTATPANIQANLENFPDNPSPPPTNIATDIFYRTTVAQFVLREFQAAWGAVPTSGASSQFDAWVARIIANPSLENGGMSQALAGTTEFMTEYGVTSATQPATAGFINLLSANLGVTPGAGAMMNVGLPVWQVLQNFVESSKVIASLDAPIANFQNLLLAGQTPAGSILTLPGTSGASLTLTTGTDTPTEGFSTGHGATAINAGAVFSALPGSNSLGLSNTLNAGDNLLATGLAAGNSTLNDTVVHSEFGNPSFAPGVTMTGVSTAVITNLSTDVAGFSGTITGLTTATLAAGSVDGVALGGAGVGLNTALTNVNINANQDFTATMTAAAFAGTTAPTGTVTLNGPVTTTVTLNADGSTTGYSALTVNSAGPGTATTANDLTLDTDATNTATITASGAEFLNLSGTALNIDNLHTFTGNATGAVDTGGLNVTFTNADGLGHVAATGGSGVDTFTFDATAAGLASFTSASSVDGGTGTSNTLGIQADTGAILLAGVGSNITDIQTIVHTTAGVQTGALTADLALAGSATTFDLAGHYNGLVTVNDITDAQTVEYSALSTAGVTDSPTDLVLNHVTPVISTNVINFEMNSSLTTPLTLTELDVAAGLKVVNIDSTGSASANIIDNVSHVQDNITVTGGTPLQLGDHTIVDAYNVANGTIDASGTLATGGVSVDLNPTASAAPGTVQTFVAGLGTNLANLFSTAAGAAGGGVIDFSHGGTDTVEFHDTQNTTTALLTDTTNQYNHVTGFTAANDFINISVGTLPGITTDYTDTGAAVMALDPTIAFNFSTGSSVSAASVHDNLIDITTPITSAAATDTPQTAFATAIGGAGAGITVAAGAASVLLSFYDNTSGDAVLATVAPAAGAITNASLIHVVGLIHESAADYAHIASNLHFVA